MKGRLLVVEDEPENRLFIGLMLRTEGFTVDEAEDGAAAFERLSRDPLPDLILLDVMMPGLNGWEVFQRIRGDSRAREIPVLMLTALAQRSDVERAVELGVDGYLTKPFEPSDLLQKISEILSGRSRARV